MRLWWKSRDQNADLLAFEGEFLTFQVDRALPLEKPVLVEAHLPNQEGHFEATLLPTHEVEPDATLKSFIEELHYAPRRHVYCARLEEPKASEPHLRILLERLPASLHHHHRLTPRLPRRVSVMSPDLPHFRGTTLDISLTGLSLRVDQPLEPGRLLPLEVIFDDGQFPPLQALARVCWCRPAPAGFVIGAHFEGLTRAQTRELEDFVQAVLERDPFPANAP